MVRRVLCTIEKHAFSPSGQPKPIPWGYFGFGTRTDTENLLKRCEKAGLLDLGRDGFEVLNRGLTPAGRELLGQLRTRIDSFEGKELENLKTNDYHDTRCQTQASTRTPS